MQSEMFIAIDASKFRTRDDFESDIDALAGVIKGLPRADEAQPIRLPGERAEEEARRRAASGVPISPRLQTQLLDLAGQCGVAPPTYTS